MNQNDISAPALDPDLLRSFLVVAEVGTVTGASEILGRTQSAISVQLRRLETAVGTALFERQARGVTLTGAGERLLPVARRILDDLQGVRAMFSTPLEGALRVGIPDDYETSLLQTVLRDFAKRHPRVDISARCALSVDFPDAVRRGELDVALYTAGPGTASGQVLFEEPLVWAAAQDWQWDGDQPIPLALFDRACWWRDCAVRTLADAGLGIRTVFESESAWGVKAAIGSGLAVGVLAESTLERGMRVLSVDEGLPPLPKTTLSLLMAKSRPDSVAAAWAEATERAFQLRARPTASVAGNRSLP